MRKEFFAGLVISFGVVTFGASMPASLFGVAHAITNATPLPSTPQYRAIVRVNNGYYQTGGGTCTGVLVSPKIVLTAGHCVIGLESPPDADGQKYQIPMPIFDGSWRRLPQGRTFTVWFTEPGDNSVACVSGSLFSSPPMTATAGHDDIALIQLDEPVPASIATPWKVQTAPLDLSSSVEISVISLGPDCGSMRPPLRQMANLNNYQGPQPNYFLATYEDPAVSGCGGDSGSPIVRGDEVIGILQRAGGAIGRVCRTASNGVLDINYADGNGRFGRNRWQSESGWCSHPGSTLLLDELTGDNREDLVCLTPETYSRRYSFTDTSGHPSMRSDAQADLPNPLPLIPLGRL